jgi:DNA-binding GntR family transcriptional regulator
MPPAIKPSTSWFRNQRKRLVAKTRQTRANGTSRTNEVFERLRTAIVMGELRPNEPLIEVELAERLQVSRTPIRESLQRLVADGLIVPRRRGWLVREYTPEEVRQRSEVRAALEGHAAYLAAERATPGDLEAIEAIHRYRLTIDIGDETLRVSTNRDFHARIIDSARNEELKNAIFKTGRFYFNLAVARATNEDQLALGNEDHARILAALKARDAYAAERHMRQHIHRTFGNFQRFAANSIGGSLPGTRHYSVPVDL